jgi:branched-chain amino acid transport system permease protein
MLAMLSCGVMGFVIERLAYKPLRRAPRLNVLITAIGVSLLLQNIGQLDTTVMNRHIVVFGASPQNMPALLENAEVARIPFGGDGAHEVVIGRVDVIIFFTSAALMLLLEFLVYRTKFGAAMRAVSFNTDTAALMGIPVDRIVSATFVLGSALAAAAGFLYVMKYPGLNQPAHAVWVLLGLKAFVAAVIGGIGNVRGAVLGGFAISFVEQFGAFYISSNYRDVYVFALLILILLVRPTGLLGSPLREKV